MHRRKATGTARVATFRSAASTVSRPETRTETASAEPTNGVEVTHRRNRRLPKQPEPQRRFKYNIGQRLRLSGSGKPQPVTVTQRHLDTGGSDQSAHAHPQRLPFQSANRDFLQTECSAAAVMYVVNNTHGETFHVSEIDLSYR